MIESASQTLGISAIAIEKDFWVYWLFGILFYRMHYRDSITFKGGTSLSKIYQVIERFSEDMDLTLSKKMFVHNLGG
jgi:predicted nucleotidyltransferase component of viral defense system